MSALPAAAEAIGTGFLGSLWQFLWSPWDIPVAVAALMVAGSWYLRRRSLKRAPFPKEQLGDDVIELVKDWKRGNVTVADDVPDAIRKIIREDRDA